MTELLRLNVSFLAGRFFWCPHVLLLLDSVSFMGPYTFKPLNGLKLCLFWLQINRLLVCDFTQKHNGW